MDNKFSKAIAAIEQNFNQENSNIYLSDIGQITRTSESKEYAMVKVQITVSVKVPIQSDSPE